MFQCSSIIADYRIDLSTLSHELLLFTAMPLIELQNISARQHCTLIMFKKLLEHWNKATVSIKPIISLLLLTSLALSTTKSPIIRHFLIPSKEAQNNNTK